MVAIGLFAVVSTGFFSVMFSGVRGADTARSIVRLTEEARLGLNRIVRDTREADDLLSPTAISYEVRTDYDASGLAGGTVYSPLCTANGELGYEDVTYAYNAVARTITLCGSTLVSGAEPITGEPIFSYTSNYLEYDTNPANGVTTPEELDDAVGVGNNNDTLDGVEINFISAVKFAFQVRDGGQVEQFRSQAQLRNRR